MAATRLALGGALVVSLASQTGCAAIERSFETPNAAWISGREGVRMPQATDLRLRYWLDEKDLSGALRLDVRGQSVEVKTSEPLVLEKLENGQPRTWTTTKWVP